MKASEGSVPAGVAIAALGVAMAVAGYLRPQGLRVPPWVFQACALAFVLAGCTVIARARGHRRLQAWLPVAILACIVSPAVWLGFGSGRRECTLSAVQGIVRIFGSRSDLACRAGFALAAVIGIALVLLALWQAIQSSRGAAGDGEEQG